MAQDISFFDEETEEERLEYRQKRFEALKAQYEYVELRQNIDHGNYVQLTEDEIADYKKNISFDFITIDSKISTKVLKKITNHLIKKIKIRKSSKIITV
jgi:hypothetical protein